MELQNLQVKTILPEIRVCKINAKGDIGDKKGEAQVHLGRFYEDGELAETVKRITMPVAKLYHLLSPTADVDLAALIDEELKPKESVIEEEPLTPEDEI